MTGRIGTAITIGRLLVAVGLLARPNRLAGLASRGGQQPPAWLVRLLGARMLLQSGLELATASRRLVRLGAVVDAVHAASMLAAAGYWPRYRSAALASAAVAGASAVAGLATAGARR